MIACREGMSPASRCDNGDVFCHSPWIWMQNMNVVSSRIIAGLDSCVKLTFVFLKGFLGGGPEELRCLGKNTFFKDNT